MTPLFYLCFHHGHSIFYLMYAKSDKGRILVEALADIICSLQDVTHFCFDSPAPEFLVFDF